MITNITGRHIEITEAIKTHIEKKVKKLSKYNQRLAEIDVVVETEGKGCKVEIIVKADNHQPFVVHENDKDAYTALDLCIDKIERQLRKHKEIVHNHKDQVSTAEAVAGVIESQEAEAEANELE
ncbi:MAG: ribosome-associated translation inhibitor RaiA [Phycisphaerae bacterium]|nr:ribosome-associated translation inhibitor RaiA [Phycisphaerae bacterium]